VSVRSTLYEFLQWLSGRSAQQITVETDQGLQNLDLTELQPVLVLGHLKADGTIAVGDASGNMPVTEENSASIKSGNTTRNNYMKGTEPLLYDAAGDLVASGTSEWIPITPVTVTADGAGNPPATEIVALHATKEIDVMLFWTVDTVAGANQYQHNFVEATAAPAVVIPDWTAIVIPVAANETQPGMPYGARMKTTNVNVNFGVANGANGDWPNAAKVTFWGYYRYLTP
jgi:hypothetical protein